jgi:hypothetical protein
VRSQRFNAAALLFLFILTPARLRAFDVNDALDALIGRKKLPRPLNSEDIPDLRPTDPQPLFTPQGDFTGDGIMDGAISGLYQFPGESQKYFLLVGTQDKNNGRYRKIFYREYANPVFLHRPGSTGEGDPGDQAFSASLCQNCQIGDDFYWNKKQNQFDLKSWKEHVVKKTVPVITQEPEPPQDVIDALLQVAGKEKNVNDFVAMMKKKGKAFGVRARNYDASKNTGEVWIYDKSGKTEQLFETLTIDLNTKQVLNRRGK